jgi:Ca-activated chloride channel family protein
MRAISLSLLVVACGGRGVVTVPPPANLVAVEVTPAHSLVRAGHRGTVAARVRIRAHRMPTAASPPVNLGLVIDTSSSMEGDAIADARAAARAVLDSMKDGDRLSLVVFHSTAEVLVPSTVLDGRSRARVAERIRSMRAHGTTDLQAGLAHGVEEVTRALKPDGINRIVLLSDGVPNDASAVVGSAQGAGQAGISITALGLGLEYDETLLTAIAQNAGGRFHFIRDSAQVASVMREEVLQLRRVVARNAQLVLTPGPGVALAAVLGQAPIQSGRVTQVSIGELAQGETRELYVELSLGAHVDGSSVELADALLVYEDAVGGTGRQERRAFAGVKARRDLSAVQESANPEVVRGLERARASAATIWVIAEARAGRLATARQKLDQAAREARAQARKLGDDELVHLADSLDELRPALPSLVAPPAPTAAASPPARAPVSYEDAEVVKETHSAAIESLQSTD